MFDVGFSEVLLIGVVALLVLGPERLPKAARFTGLWVRRARSQWDSVRTELERELAAEDIKRSVEQARRQATDLTQGLSQADASVRSEARALEQQVRGEPEQSAAPAGQDAGTAATGTGAVPDKATPAATETAAQTLPDQTTPAPAGGQSFDLEVPLPVAPADQEPKR